MRIIRRWQIKFKVLINGYPITLQENKDQSGPACLNMVCQYYGKNVSLSRLEKLTKMDDEGTNLADLSSAALDLGLHNTPVRIAYNDLFSIPLPAIIHWEGWHFVVLYKANSRFALIGDPLRGLHKLNKEDFCNHWLRDDCQEKIEKGVILLLEPTSSF